jgi:hypothetical protein
MHFGIGLGLLAALAAGLVVLDHIELGRAVTGTLAIPAAIAAAAVWLAGAWLAAVASREGRSALVAVLAAGGAGLTLILTVLHGLTAPTGRPGPRARDGSARVGPAPRSPAQAQTVSTSPIGP